MYTQTVLIALLTAVADARFGQEQGNGAIAAISALSDLGQSGQAATLAGGSIQFLLAAANPCGKLSQADNIVAELGTSDRAIAAARGLVAAEQNFNPFVVSIPSICSDPTLPTTEALRGVVPLIDPAVVGEVLENANSNKSIITPFSATGLSVAQVMVAQGFSNFTAVALDGTKTSATDLGTSASSSSSSSNSTSSDNSTSSAETSTSAAIAIATSSSIACGGTTFVTVTQAATSVASAQADSTETTSAAAAASTTAASSASSGTSSTRDASTLCTGSGSTLVCSAPAVGAGAVTNAVTGNFGGFVASTNSSLDFGICVPTMKFEAGLDGRATTESTFQAQDPLVNQGQEEALNPVIIANRIHDQLTNVCGANDAAKSAAAAAQTLISTLGKVSTTADAWNTALGFAGTNLNPDNAPQTGLVGHT